MGEFLHTSMAANIVRHFARLSRIPGQTAWRGMCGNSSAKSGGLLRSTIRRYDAALEAYPIATKAITSGVIVGGGDVLCQVAFESDRKFDFRRAAIMSFLGTALLAPTLHCWYGFLGSIVPRLVPSSLSGQAAKVTGTLMRVTLDQFTFAPCFVATFMSSVILLEGRGMGAVVDSLSKDWWGAICVNWLLWIPAQMITFAFVPLKFQVLWVNMVGLVWNSYLSFASHKTIDVEAEH